MSIESDFKQFRIHLSRIADALEALLAERGYVPTGPTSIEDDDNDPTTRMDVDKALDKVRKKKAKKGKGKAIVVGKKKDKDDDVIDVKEVRKALTLLQESLGQSHVKSLLKKYGASTLGQLDESKYQRVIDDAMEDVEDPDD